MLITVMLTAALASTPSAPPPAPDQGNAPVLTVTGDCPGTKTFTVTQATPNDRVFLFIGRSGPTVLPPPDCAGLVVDVAVGHVQILQTNGQGKASASHRIPLRACAPLVAQAVDIPTCRKSSAEVIHDHGDWDVDEAERKELRGPVPLAGTLEVENLGGSAIVVRTWKSGGQVRLTRIAARASSSIPLQVGEQAWVADVSGDQLGTNGTWEFTAP